MSEPKLLSASAEEAAANIIAKINELAADAAKRFDAIHGRAEDWLNEDFRRRMVTEVVRDVLVNYLLGRQS